MSVRREPTVQGPWPALFVVACGAALAMSQLPGTGALGAALLGLAVAVPLLVHSVRRPALVAAQMVVVEVANVSGVLAEWGLPSVFRLMLLYGAVAAALALRRPELRARLDRWTFLAAALVGVYLGSLVLTLPSSVDVGASVGAIARVAIDLAFGLIVLVLVQLGGRTWFVASAAVLTMAAIAGLSVVNQLVLHDPAAFAGFARISLNEGELIVTPRHSGPLPDSNFWGRHLVMGLPFALALATHQLSSGTSNARRWQGLLHAGAALAIAAGVYLTQSRGTLLAAGVAVAVWVVASGPRARRLGLRLVPVVVVAAFLVPGIGDRFLLLVEQASSTATKYTVDPSVLGRVEAQEVAWKIFSERPLVGSGPGTYEGLVPAYAGFVETAVPDPPPATHNLYLELLSDTGVVGLAGWAVMFGGFLAMTLVALARTRQWAPGRLVLAAAPPAALLAWALASVLLHLAFPRTLAVFLALGVAVLSDAGPPVPAATRARLLRWTGTVAAAVAVATAVGLGVARATAGTAATATQQVTLVPVLDEHDGWYSYLLDLRTRRSTLPSYAALVIDPDDAAVSAVSDPVRGLITVSAEAPDRGTAAEQLRVAIDRAQGRSAAKPYLGYVLRLVGEPTTTRHRTHPTPGLLLAAGSATLAGGGVLLLARFRRRRTPAAPAPTTMPREEALA
ncbi:O-antigen ligase family protein [Nocardioides sp. YIM 152588]|uniref:O-antigen ligase family protein n=1 Tax=Nocardioides sp. YIM 152588 TaxID=3158259 RepID=UPI0032E3DEBE